jgi:hypothetical protein
MGQGAVGPSPSAACSVEPTVAAYARDREPRCNCLTGAMLVAHVT